MTMRPSSSATAKPASQRTLHSLSARVSVAWLLSILLATIGGGCGKSPGDDEPKKKQVLLQTAYHDEIVGDETALQIAAEMGILDSQELTDYVAAIGKRMLPYAPPRPFDYTFLIIDQAAPNAFALPGGHIYVSRGLLTLSNSEDELACVIGHEITHSAERHAASQQEAARRLNPLSIGYMRMGLIASYGRNQERDADRGGQTMAARAGWDPRGMAAFLQGLDASERLSMGWSRLPSYFASHPATPERSATAAHRADTIQWTRKPGVAKDHSDFLSKLDGLVIGPNPKEGVFVGQRFLHSDMGFTLRFPKDWRLANSSQAVGAGSPRGDAQVFLMFSGTGDDPEANAREYIDGPLKEQRGNVQRMRPIKIGPYDAFRVDAKIPGSGQSYAAQLTFIAFEGTIFRLHAMSTSGKADDYGGRFQSTARSFRAMTGEERDMVYIMRLSIVEAQRGETLAMLSARTGNSLPIPETGVLNDIFLDTRLRGGQQIKIGRAEPYVPATQVRPPVQTEQPGSDRGDVGG